MDGARVPEILASVYSVGTVFTVGYVSVGVYREETNGKWALENNK